MKSLTCFVTVALVLLLAPLHSVGQEKWLTDEEAREVAAATVHAVYPEDCYSTYRKESLESWVFSERKDQLVGHEVNRSVYMYGVVSDSCEYVVEENGHTVLRSMVHTHETGYGIVAVDRRTRKTYWFHWSNKPAEVFRRFVQDEELRPGTSYPQLFASLYRELVWGTSDANEVMGISQLRRLVEDNFRSAYSPYEQDEKWERKFAAWWREFRFRMPQLRLNTTAESTSEGIVVRGFSFSGFELTIPRNDPPPKGTPKLFRWTLLLKQDGSVEERPASITYSAR